MAWARLDDRYDDNPKIKRAWRRHPAAVGLHTMAVTYACRHELDGLIDFEWIEEKLPVKRDRDLVCAALVDCGLFEACDSGFKVHDFLEFNPSREVLQERRLRDRLRKGSNTVPLSIPPDSTRKDIGKTLDTAQPSRAPAGDARGRRTGRVEVPGSHQGENKQDARAVDQGEPPATLPPQLHPVARGALTRLTAVHAERGGSVPTLRGVGLALMSFPDRDHLAVMAELEHWALAGHGQHRAVRDWVRTYRTFLDRSPAATPTRLGDARAQRKAGNAAAITSLLGTASA